MTTTHILSKAISAGAALVLIQATATHAATFVNTGTGADGAGELFVGIHATGGQGNGISVVIDLGAVSPLAALNAGQTMALGSVGTDLAAQFGNTWYTRTDLLWSAVSAVQSTVPTTSTDPTSTLYGSVASTGAFPLTTTAYNRATNSTQNSVAQKIVSNMANAAAGSGGFAQAPTGATSNIAIESASYTNSYATWMPNGSNATGVGNVPFGGFGNPAGVSFEQAFGAGTSNVEGALDIYQMYKTGTAQPDAGNATTGAGAYEFTLEINQSGNIQALALPVPEPASIGLLMAGGACLLGVRRRSGGSHARNGIEL